MKQYVQLHGNDYKTIVIAYFDGYRRTKFMAEINNKNYNVVRADTYRSGTAYVYWEATYRMGHGRRNDAVQKHLNKELQYE